MNTKFSHNKIDSQRYALFGIINLIAQEIYKVAVKKMYSSECNKISTLFASIRKEFIKIEDYLGEYTCKDITECLVNEILSGTSHDSILEIINNYLDKEYEKNKGGDNDHECCEFFNRGREFCLEAINRILHLNNKFVCKIPFKYPPYVFCIDNDYLQSLFYYHGLEYEPKLSEGGSKITMCQQPYETRPPYGKTNYERKPIQREVIVPNSTFKNKNPKITLTEDQLIEIEALCFLDMVADKEVVHFTHELHFKIDMSTPLTNSQVKKIIGYIQSDLSFFQRQNKENNCIMAENIIDLVSAYSAPDITCVHFIDLMEQRIPDIPGLKNKINAKNFLCGLIILHQKLFEPEKMKISIYNLCEELSECLSKKLDTSTFSVETIFTSYKKVNKIYKGKLNELKQGQ